ncbi:hypothetical protein CORT_0C02520 [Candida orthopsilosis Co 90-125]|uniref:Uncharacterized protein n=1 Tax=Candida orthopsilosis (strain 90-125) TaxID=1136231 RepID=H8X2T0_CANO9|nr:hypothetical protein CORT_0C02520 [Candida orthopsilosis Co 90-125]CCG25627.1 hypothetical protein CORT_0C02520 [Candida orthopsilosis Co 90-125]
MKLGNISTIICFVSLVSGKIVTVIAPVTVTMGLTSTITVDPNEIITTSESTSFITSTTDAETLSSTISKSVVTVIVPITVTEPIISTSTYCPETETENTLRVSPSTTQTSELVSSNEHSTSSQESQSPESISEEQSSTMVLSSFHSEESETYTSSSIDESSIMSVIDVSSEHVLQTTTSSEETEFTSVESSTEEITSSLADLTITSQNESRSIDSTTFESTPETGSSTVFSYSLEGPSSVQTDSPYSTFFESSSLLFESTSLKASFSKASIETGSSSAGIEVKIQTTSESSTVEESSVNVFSKTSSLVSTLLSSNEFSSLNYSSSIPPPLSTTTNIETTIITTTSCSGDICSKVTHTNDLTTVTEDATVYTTYSTLFTSVESASGEELFILSQSDDISFSTSLSPPEPNTEYSGSMPVPPYSVIKSNAFPVEVLRTMTCSSEECLTSLAAIPSSEVESSMENQTEEQVTLSSTESQEVIPTTTAESIPPIESSGATTSVAVPSTLSAVDHSSELIEGVTDSSKEVTTDKPESHVTTIVSYNSEKDVITKITSTIETTSRVQRSSIKSDVEVPQATTESSPEEVSEEGTLATGTTLLDSTSLVYNAQETFAVSSNLESPAVSTYEGSALVNTPELAVVCGMLFYFI